jgi:Electron transfer DM13
MRRKTWILLAAVVLVVLGAVTLIWFQPQKLFYDDTVSEAIPTATATAEPTGSDETASPVPTEPVEVARGTFISREHETTGTARILRLPDGQQILRLEGFETSNGPALYVYLSQNPADGEDGLFDDDYVDLGELKGNIGDQNYVIPAEIDPLGFTSVVVWCDRFSVSFGAADLAATDV